MRKLLTAVLLLSLFGAGSAGAEANQPKMYGFFDGSNIRLAAQLGITTVEKDVWVNSTYRQLSDLPARDRADLADQLKSARSLGVKVILNLWQINWISKTDPPNQPNKWRGVCNVASNIIDNDIHDASVEGAEPAISGLVVGVEPNSRTFWESQSNAPETYQKWLATCYSWVKPFHPDLPIYGGSLASKAGPGGTGPGEFIVRMCHALKKSGRTLPIMDGFDMHSYQDEAPQTQHPNTDTITIGDYPKLQKLLSCFGQGPMPVLWGELGYQTKVPAAQGYLYYSRETGPTVDEATQGQYYAEAIRLAQCQPYTVGLFFFHLVDDGDKRQWQSGLVRANSPRQLADGSISYSAKQSLPVVLQSAAAAQSGTLQCS